MMMKFFGETQPVEVSSMDVFYATIVGLIVGALISSVTEYYTGLGKKPILKIVQQSSTGAATNIISGFKNDKYQMLFLSQSIVTDFGLVIGILRALLITICETIPKTLERLNRTV